MFINNKRPNAPSHYRYLNLGPRLHPLYGIGGVQFGDYSYSDDVKDVY